MLSLLAPSRPARREAPTVFTTSATSAIAGEGDPDAPTADRIRLAYRGLIHRCATLRANAAVEALAQMGVAEDLGGGDAGGLRDLGPDHPRARLLRRPSPHLAAREVWKWAQLAKDLGRGAFFFVERDRAGAPLYLHPVFPAFGQVAPIGTADGGVAGYVFQPSGGGRAQRWEAEDVLWVRHVHPVTPYESASLLEAAAYEIDTDRWERVYRRDNMRAGGYPSVYITTDQDLNQAQATQYGETFEARYLRPIQGGQRSRRVPVFGKGAEPKPLAVPARDLQFVEGAELTKTDLLQIWGVPEGMLSDKANRANADAARYTFYQNTAMPEADDAAASLSVQLDRVFRTPPADRMRVVVTVPDIVPSDPELILRQNESALRSGTRTVNELREADGLQPVDGGDVPLVSAALVPLAQVVAEPEPVPPALAAAGADDPDDDEEGADEEEADEEDGDGDDERSHGPPAQRRAADPRAYEWRAVDRRRQRAEATVEQASRQALQEMGRAVADAVRGAERAGPDDVVSVDTVFDLAVWTERWAAAIAPALAAAVRRGFDSGALRVAALGDEFGELAYNVNSPASARALARSIEKATSVPNTMRRAVAREIAGGLDAGESREAIAARVQALFDDMVPWKARQIARTSGTACFEGGQISAYVDGGVTGKGWLSERDGQVRPEHQTLDGERVPVDDPFSNGLDYPQEPNCRCTTYPVMLDEEESDEPRTWAQRRNVHIRSEYRRRIADRSEARGVIIEDLRTGTFEGQAYALAAATIANICDYGRA